MINKLMKMYAFVMQQLWDLWDKSHFCYILVTQHFRYSIFIEVGGEKWQGHA